MWILIKKTYTGPEGVFPAGQKYDLPDATVKLLPEKCYKKTCAPWEEQTDKKLVARNNAEQNFLTLQQTANNLRLRIDETIAKIDELSPKVPHAVEIIKSAMDEESRNKLKAMRLEALLGLAVVNRRLQNLDLEKIQATADAAKAKFDKLSPKPEPKPKEPENSKDGNEQQADTASQSAEPAAPAESAAGDGNTEGQTTPPEAGE